jgi:hypothetical protein
MGQELPGEIPQVFAPDFIGSGLHACPVFTPDGLEAYWGILAPDKTMMLSKEVNGSWINPKAFEFPSEFIDSDAPCLTVDGNRLFFLTFLPITPGAEEKYNIWFMDRDNDSWTYPQPLPECVNSLDTWGQLSVAENQNLYFHSTVTGNGDIYLSRFINDQYTTPEPLSSTINKPGTQDLHPFIAPDESYIIFCRVDPGAGHYFTDLYISFKDGSDSWCEAVPMEESNTPFHDCCPNVSRDGRYLFFVRDAVYWVDASIINQYQSVVCGDANKDGGTNIGDSVFIINHVFKGGPAPDPICIGNVNGDSGINVGDAVYLINHIFKAGPPPDESCCQ